MKTQKETKHEQVIESLAVIRREEGYNLGLIEGKAQALAEVMKIIDEMFPICTCIDGKSGQEPNISCKSDLMDGVWSDGLNKRLKAKLEQVRK